MKRRKWGVLGLIVLGVFFLNSCGKDLEEQIQTIESEIIEVSKGQLEEIGRMEEIEGIESKQKNEDEIEEWYEIIVNVEEADLTHDGVMDKIVSKISYPAWSKGKTAKELLNGAGRCFISVYDGKGLVEDGLNFEGICIWEKVFSTLHPENAQLYLMKDEGMDYLLWTTDYSIMGHACYSYQVFYLSGEVEMIEAEDERPENSLGFSYGKEGEIIKAEGDGHFSYDNVSTGNIEFPVEHLIAYTEDLGKYMEGSTLLVYCNVYEARVRTFDEECSANVFELWNFLKSYNNGNEFTIETLRGTMEQYYKEEWNHIQ